MTSKARSFSRLSIISACLSDAISHSTNLIWFKRFQLNSASHPDFFINQSSKSVFLLHEELKMEQRYILSHKLLYSITYVILYNNLYNLCPSFRQR